jgi:hypothetical protein
VRRSSFRENLSVNLSVETASVAPRSCQNHNNPLARTIVRITIASVRSRRKIDSPAANIRIKTIGLLNWFMNNPIAIDFRCCLRLFALYLTSLCLASRSRSVSPGESLKPSVDEFSCRSTRSAGRLQNEIFSEFIDCSTVFIKAS